MSESTPAPEHADWTQVGAAFRALGVQLRDHAVQAGGALREVGGGSGKVVDEIGDALRTALHHFDQTVTDPAIGASARAAVSQLLDAIKVEVNRPPTP